MNPCPRRIKRLSPKWCPVLFYQMVSGTFLPFYAHICPALAGASPPPGAVSLSYTPDPVGAAPYRRRTMGPARLSLRHPAGSQAGCAGSRDRYAPHLPSSHDADACLSYADPYKMARQNGTNREAALRIRELRVDTSLLDVRIIPTGNWVFRSYMDPYTQFVMRH